MKAVILQHALAALFPGCGHFLIDRPLRAAVFALVFFCCLEGTLLTVLVDDPAIASAAFHSCIAILVLSWMLSHADLVRARRLRGAVTEETFIQGIGDYLRGDLDACEQKMRKLISADPYDANARMYLSLILQEKGNVRAARRQLRKCRRVDLEGALEWETKTELERLKALPDTEDT